MSIIIVIIIVILTLLDGKLLLFLIKIGRFNGRDTKESDLTEIG